MSTLQLGYPQILKLFGIHAMKERTESRAFLAWFLENYYRLDETEVSDCICDGKYDKGIDGIYVNEQLGHVDVFQSSLAHSNKTLGDTSLKEFEGTLSQFKNKDSVDNLQKTSKNPALTSLLKRNDIATKVGEGYVVRGVFITNVARDSNAKDFLATHSTIVLYDGPQLEKSYTPLDKTAPIAQSISFNIGSVPHMEYQLSAKVKMVIASLAAEDLIGMGGIANGELFAWNVRQFLGRKTKVNKDIEKSIKDAKDHQLFPAFHNGLTVLCDTLNVKKDKLTIAGYAVVNGCQSLRSLWDNKKDLTHDLRIITKFINVPPNDPLATKITDHTNNQNGTTFRDLQSNNPIQVRLQSEIHRQYKDTYFRIKRGEHPEWPPEHVIENELIAKVLLAFDLKDPASCHQTYKLFDELHASIFGRPQVNSDRIILASDIYGIIVALLDSMDNKLFGHYTLTKYLLIYLLREALETDAQGAEVCKNPSAFFTQKDGRKKVKEAIAKAAGAIVRILDTWATKKFSIEDEREYFDYKSDLKSPRQIKEIRAHVISSYQVMVDNKYAPSFSDAIKNGVAKTK
ncbi:MAG: AIPR family protein [Terriglobales bacterium]